MPFKVLPMLAGILMFSPASKAIDSNETLSLAPDMNGRENSSRENLDRLRETHDYDEIFGDYQMGSSSD